MILTTLEIAALIVALEFAVLAWAGPVLLLRRRTRSASAEAEGAATLLAEVENKMPSRREALTTIFASTYQLEGDELEAKIEEFVEREQAFYQVMTSVYLDRDPERLKEIPEELTKVISPWIRMTPKNMVDASSLDELATANSALNAELDETKRSMDELMAEYVAAFNKAEKLAAEQAEPADVEGAADAAAEADLAANAAAAPGDNTEEAAGETAAGEPEADKPLPEDPQAVAATEPESDPEPGVAGTTAQTKPDEATPATAEAADEDEFPQADAAVALGDFGDEVDSDDAVATADADDAQAQAAAAEDPPAPPVIDLDADPDEEPAANAPRTPAAPLSIDLSADPDEELSKDDLDALFADDLGALEEPESASA